MRGPLEYLAQANNIPSSEAGWTAVLMVGVLAGAARLARILYGNDAVRLRIALASFIIASLAAVMVYSAIVEYFKVVSGYAGVGIGVFVGLFTDEVLRHSREAFTRKMRAIKQAALDNKEPEI